MCLRAEREEDERKIEDDGVIVICMNLKINIIIYMYFSKRRDKIDCVPIYIFVGTGKQLPWRSG